MCIRDRYESDCFENASSPWRKQMRFALPPKAQPPNWRKSVRETPSIRLISEGYLIEHMVTTQITKPTGQQKNAVIMDVYIPQITASLAVKHAVIVEKLITLRSHAAVESAETCRQHKGSRPSTRSSIGEKIRTKYTWSTTSQWSHAC